VKIPISHVSPIPPLVVPKSNGTVLSRVLACPGFGVELHVPYETGETCVSEGTFHPII
jgi:hypothetical protein